MRMINSAVNLILIKSYIDKNKDYFNEANNDSKNKNNYKLLNYACLLLPYKNYEIPESKNKSIILSKIIAAKKLLLPKSDINDIILKIEGENELINFLKKSKEEIFKRYNISQYLIKYKYKNLVDIIKLAICDEYLNIKNRDNNEIIESIDNDIIKSLYEKYKEIVEYIKKEKMENIENIKPLLDGKEIIKILNIKDGKKIKNFLDLILKEQINNPNITKDDCINLIKAQQ